jgi:outer membrane protein OmpA-like peptidoglycan-associated protein
MLPSDYLAPINDSLVATIHFSINKVELSDSDKTNIRMALEPFMEDKSIMYFVNGYTDNTGNPMLNEELSSKRANTVMKELIGLGIDDLSIIAKGWGEANMVASNDTEEGQRRNRRVEIIIKR